MMRALSGRCPWPEGAGAPARERAGPGAALTSGRPRRGLAPAAASRRRFACGRSGLRDTSSLAASAARPGKSEGCGPLPMRDPHPGLPFPHRLSCAAPASALGSRRSASPGSPSQAPSIAACARRAPPAPAAAPDPGRLPGGQWGAPGPSGLGGGGGAGGVPPSRAPRRKRATLLAARPGAGPRQAGEGRGSPGERGPGGRCPRSVHPGAGRRAGAEPGPGRAGRAGRSGPEPVGGDVIDSGNVSNRRGREKGGGRQRGRESKGPKLHLYGTFSAKIKGK